METLSQLIRGYHVDAQVVPGLSKNSRLGTTSFYNYLYYTVICFTENGMFRSKRIREGQIIREDALKIVREENKPRYESIRLFLDTIGLNFNEIIKAINAIPKIF